MSNSTDQKSLMELDHSDMSILHNTHSTGMGFYIVNTEKGYVAVLLDGAALPLYPDGQFYCIDDMFQGVPLPLSRKAAPQFSTLSCLSNRGAVVASLSSANISPAYIGSFGASPLIGSDKLAAKATFLRYISGSSDHRFVGGKLTPGTYITSISEAVHADTGFGAVGRFALPIPLPASHMLEYELPAGTNINVGTVAPLFGQSGGGIEICLPSASSATLVNKSKLPDY